MSGRERASSASRTRRLSTHVISLWSAWGKHSHSFTSSPCSCFTPTVVSRVTCVQREGLTFAKLLHLLAPLCAASLSVRLLATIMAPSASFTAAHQSGLASDTLETLLAMPPAASEPTHSEGAWATFLSAVKDQPTCRPVTAARPSDTRPFALPALGPRPSLLPLTAITASRSIAIPVPEAADAYPTPGDSDREHEPTHSSPARLQVDPTSSPPTLRSKRPCDELESSRKQVCYPLRSQLEPYHRVASLDRRLSRIARSIRQYLTATESWRVRFGGRHRGGTPRTFGGRRRSSATALWRHPAQRGPAQAPTGVQRGRRHQRGRGAR